MRAVDSDDEECKENVVAGGKGRGRGRGGAKT